MRLYIWKWGIADNGNPIYNWSEDGSLIHALNEQHITDIPDTTYTFWLNPEEKNKWYEMDFVDRNEYVGLLYEEHVR